MRAWGALGIALASLALIGASLAIGTETLRWADVWADWRSGLPVAETRSLSIVVYHRLPRTLAALVAGAGLALAGCAFQALLRNPLATPYTLGVASFAALGAWCGFLMMDAGWPIVTLIGAPAIQVMALLFAAADITLIYLLAVRRAATSPAVLLLAGVTLGMLANSGILFTRYLAQPDRLVMMDRWLMGGVDVLGYRPVWVLALGAAPFIAILLAQAGRLDQFGFSAEMAAGRGVNVGRLQLVVFLAASALTAILVSEVGPIGFVGLVVPHAVRAFTGPAHRVLMPLCLLAGGGFLCACDIAARVLTTGELPIGIVTTLIGGPFFLYLLMRRRFTHWEG